jgi:ATP-binding cassette subfamily C (CFTR/MRP) protein 10
MKLACLHFREIKRLMTVSLSPVYAHFSETLIGLATIRALRASGRFLVENETRLELNQRANFSGKARM